MAALSFERKGQLQGTPMPQCAAVCRQRSEPTPASDRRLRYTYCVHSDFRVPALAIIGPDASPFAFAAAAAAPVSVLAVFGCLVIVRDGLPGRSAVEAPFSSFPSSTRVRSRTPTARTYLARSLAIGGSTLHALRSLGFLAVSRAVKNTSTYVSDLQYWYWIVLAM